MKYLKINWKNKKIEITEQKSFDSVEYEPSRATDSNYVREILRKALAIYERGEPIRTNYKTVKTANPIRKETPIARQQPMEYTSRALTGIIIRNEKERKELIALKLKIKE